MKPGWIVFVPLVLLAATDVLKAADPPHTTMESDRNYQDKAHYQSWVKQELGRWRDKPCDLIFIGDSITAQWLENAGRPVWEKHYAWRAFNFGLGADKTEHTLWRLQNLDLSGIQPKAAVILIGTNNVHDSVEDIAAGVKAVVATTRRIFPNAKIVLVSLLPRDVAAEKMMSVNAVVRKEADNKAVFYLDLASKFTRSGKSWKGLSPDRLHLSTEGYEMWAAELNPLLEKLLQR